ncbi:hypothetical protein [Massilia sp. H6]|uniref:hypothetical protein n=1 Tax=Massilia sp. H6 TaxID=2970464 RepID=UPI0021688EB6|nr:hypothetical protein [Massilia sp. H6]UVW29888.1 hypothetical protein NRS07_07155 [Massilia sp. H6]
MHVDNKFAKPGHIVRNVRFVRFVPLARIAGLAPRRTLARWCAFGMLCAVIGAACLAERLPLLPG